MTFSVCDERGDFEYNGSSPNGLFAKRAHLVTPWFHRMVADLVRFNREARDLLRIARGPVAARLARRPRLLARVRRAPDRAAGGRRLVGRPGADVDVPGPLPGRVLRQPRDARPRATGRSWRTVAGGSRALRRGADRARGATGCGSRRRSRSIQRHDDHVTVTPRGGAPERFDEVVLAAHADQALAMLADPSDREHEMLGAFPYQRNEAVLHTDRRLLPRRRRAWASWNYHLLAEPTGLPTVTYHMNRLQSLAADQRVLRHAEPDRGDRPGEGRSARSPTPTRSTRRPASPRRRRHDEISGPRPHALLRRLLGLGLPRGRRRQRDPRRRAAGSAAA